MYTCFFITPIGESGSETRQNADDLREMLLKPVLEPLGFNVVRGDHRPDAAQIDIDIIRAVQESDLCVVDLSQPNANVYYEFGRRDETGKPLILLKAKGSPSLPVDVATRRYIEYDLDSRRGLISAYEQLKNFVVPIVEQGFESAGHGATMTDLAEILRRMERKLDRLSAAPGTIPGILIDKCGDNGGTEMPPDIDPNVDPVDLLKYALRQRNIPQAEQAMSLLSVRMNRHRWIDQIVEQVAAIGSVPAGDIMIESAMQFIDETESFKDKIDFLGCLVSNLIRTDRERDNLELVEQICRELKASSVNEDEMLRIHVNNQLNKLYFGIYQSTDDPIWLEKAISELGEALEIADDVTYLHYNLATCLKGRNKEDDLNKALEHALRAIELGGEEKDNDHIQLVCELMHTLDDERVFDYLDLPETVNPIKARLLRSEWRR